MEGKYLRYTVYFLADFPVPVKFLSPKYLFDLLPSGFYSNNIFSSFYLYTSKSDTRIFLP